MTTKSEKTHANGSDLLEGLCNLCVANKGKRQGYGADSSACIWLVYQERFDIMSVKATVDELKQGH